MKVRLLRFVIWAVMKLVEKVICVMVTLQEHGKKKIKFIAKEYI